MALSVSSALTMTLALTACGGVRVDGSGPTDPETQAACEELLASLPELLDGRDQVATRGDAQAAAWGDPAVVLRCGVPEPAGLTPFSRCEVVDDVDWFAPEEQAADQTLDAVLTTVGRDPRVEVTVPAELRPPVAVLSDLADAVRRHTREIEPCR